jgi:hypothetical protein
MVMSVDQEGAGSGGRGAATVQRVVVTLALAHGPGFPDGSPERRYELEVALDQRGCLDSHAWTADPEPWPVRRLWPGEPEQRGDVQHDPDTGWSLRIFPAAAVTGDPASAAAAAPDLSDAPLHRLFRSPGPMRPGGYVTITEPGSGGDYDYRIVGVG